MTPPPSGLANAAGSLRQEMAAASSICQISPTRCQARTRVYRDGFQRRKSLVLLRRILIPMSEVAGELMRRDLHVVGDDLMPCYQDVYDQVLRAAEWTDSLRDVVTSILETNAASPPLPPLP